MKFQILFLGLGSLVAGLVPLPMGMSPAAAQCVMTDVSVQVAVRGAKTPIQQTNDVDMQSGKACVGNTSTHTNTQVYVGGGDKVIQKRKSVHRLDSPDGNPTGINIRPVKVPIEVKVDVYNPAERLR